MINPDLIHQFIEKLESRNATDFLLDLIENYDGHLGSFLLGKHRRTMLEREEFCNNPDCDHCNPFDDDVIG